MTRQLTIGLLALACAGVVSAASPAHATAAPQGQRSATANSADEMAQGEVRRISKDSNKITLRHGPIKSLDMPPMSMVFTVRDPALLDRLKVGDQVEFSVIKDADGSFVVTAIRPKS